jgi:hypothetical protein
LMQHIGTDQDSLLSRSGAVTIHTRNTEIGVRRIAISRTTRVVFALSTSNSPAITTEIPAGFNRTAASMLLVLLNLLYQQMTIVSLGNY